MTTGTLNYRIRPARKSDSDAIAGLKFEGDAYHSRFDLWPPECDMAEAGATVRKHLADSKSKIFVADHKGTGIVGFILATMRERETRHPEYRNIGEIGLIFVMPDHRRMGLGKKLVARAVEHFESNEIQQVTLRVVAQNAPGIGFWESISFETKVLAKTTTTERIRRCL